MEFKDDYRVLGVERGADAETLKRAWRRLARRYHPDVDKAPDPDKRAACDRLGSRWQAGEGFVPPPGRDAGFAPRRRLGA